MKARVLISFHHARAWDFEQLLERAGVDERPDLWADSGAFSAFTLGVPVSVEEYADWLDRWAGWFSAACVLDVIGDPVGTMRNLERLEELGHRVLPVYHMRADRWDIFDHICDHYGHACLGGMAGTGVKHEHRYRFLVSCMRRARDRGSGIVFHALGIVSDRVLNHLPIYSADCSTWASGRRWGYVQAFDARTGSLLDIPMSKNPAMLGKYGPLLREHGLVDPGRLLREKPPLRILDGLATVAFLKREAWIRERVGLVHRPDEPDAEPGLRLYMSMTSTDQVHSALAAAAHVDDPTLPVAPLDDLTDEPWRALK